jgi:hypothetical protein
MLQDPKSDRFVKGFLEAWLTLDNLGNTPPDQNRFSEYYIDDLATAMREETHIFFRHILDKNLPTSEFLTAEYSFMNPALARHYRMDLPNNRFKNPDSFIKVNTNGHPRGGLLGQASIHTVTANGVGHLSNHPGSLVTGEYSWNSPCAPTARILKRLNRMFVDPPPFVIKWKNTAPTPPVPSVTVRSIPLDLHWKTLTPSVATVRPMHQEDH